LAASILSCETAGVGVGVLAGLDVDRGDGGAAIVAAGDGEGTVEVGCPAVSQPTSSEVVMAKASSKSKDNFTSLIVASRCLDKCFTNKGVAYGWGCGTESALRLKPRATSAKPACAGWDLGSYLTFLCLLGNKLLDWAEMLRLRMGEDNLKAR
jgi:hypothetical protein